MEISVPKSKRIHEILNPPQHNYLNIFKFGPSLKSLGYEIPRAMKYRELELHPNFMIHFKTSINVNKSKSTEISLRISLILKFF